MLVLLLAAACGGSSKAGAPAETATPRGPASTAAVTEVPSPTPQTAPNSTPSPQPTAAPAPAAASPVPASGGSTSGSIAIRASNLEFAPKTITVRSGQTVVVSFTNADATVPHDLVFRVSGVSEGAICTGPCSYTLSFVAPAPGSYQFVCTTHDSWGMGGTLLVTP